MSQEEFGLEKGWFDRVTYYSERNYIEYVQPAKRTTVQKFEMSTLMALTELKHLNWYTLQEENQYLSSTLYQHLKSLDKNTMNAPVFAFLGNCVDLSHHKLIYTSDQRRSIEGVLKLLRNPSKDFQEFFKKYGVTLKDTIRYIIYIEKYLSTK